MKYELNKCEKHTAKGSLLGRNGIYFNDHSLGNHHIPHWVNKGSGQSGERVKNSVGWEGSGGNVKYFLVLVTEHQDTPLPSVPSQAPQPGAGLGKKAQS
jgi:hypothetical protein